MAPLTGIRVLDFSTLLPGPLATLMLFAAGAEVVKIERPGGGDEMRSYDPKLGGESVNFALLNRGKRSVAIDLKAPGAVDRLRPLIESADVVVEQFRPGVMDRLGLGYDALRRINPKIIYCAITGYGQSGPRANEAGHDLNFIALTGMLGLAAGADGAPVLPAALVADIGGGSLPAVVNILLALRQRDATGAGCRIDVSMCDNLFAWQYWSIGNGTAAGEWPKAGAELVTGGSPRYQIYRTADGRFVAAAPLEDRFWIVFCELIGLPEALRDDARDPAATQAAVADIIARNPADHWRRKFEGRDICCNIVQDVRAALSEPHFRERGVFGRSLAAGDKRIPALPLPLDSQFRADAETEKCPPLGADTGKYIKER
ncbi:MAG: CoA transferase [Rhodospirillales bacterium]|nr:CoA transferase [Rhodospirillales bacterium]